MTPNPTPAPAPTPTPTPTPTPNPSPNLQMSLAPLAASCAASDLGCQSSRRPGDEHAERLLLFERRRGGVGLAAQLLGA